MKSLVPHNLRPHTSTEETVGDKRLGPQPQSSKHTQDLREQLNIKRTYDAKKMKELDKL